MNLMVGMSGKTRKIILLYSCQSYSEMLMIRVLSDIKKLYQYEYNTCSSI